MVVVSRIDGKYQVHFFKPTILKVRMGGSGSKQNNGGQKVLTPTDETQLELMEQRDDFTKKRRKLEHIMEREQEGAKELLRQGKRERARLALRRRRYQADRLKRLEDLHDNIQVMIDKIDDASTNLKVIEAMKKGYGALLQLERELKVEDVELLMEETVEAIQRQNEISDLLRQSLTPVEDAEVEDQLDAMMKLSEVRVPQGKVEGSTVTDVNVPTHKVGEDGTQQQQTNDASEPVAA